MGEESLLHSGSWPSGKIRWAMVPKAILQAKRENFRGEGAGKAGGGSPCQRSECLVLSHLSTGP